MIKITLFCILVFLMTSFIIFLMSENMKAKLQKYLILKDKPDAIINNAVVYFNKDTNEIDTYKVNEFYKEIDKIKKIFLDCAAKYFSILTISITTICFIFHLMK